MINKMHGTSFDWLTWINSNPLDIIYREEEILKQRERIRQYAIGYCNGDELLCRPKQDCVGVMFLKDNIQFWFHLTNKEFEVIFEGEY